MLKAGLLLLRILTAPVPGVQNQSDHNPAITAAIDAIAKSGRCVNVAEAPDDRVSPPNMIPPGKPPLLSFRFYEAKAHHGAGNSGLMLDDAGH
jgi:hypothetical protein